MDDDIKIQAIKLLYCLSEEGLHKAHAMLTILANSEFANISPEELETSVQETNERFVEQQQEKEEERLRTVNGYRRLLNRIDRTSIPGGFDLMVHETTAIYAKNQGSVFSNMSDAYTLGFFRGTIAGMKQARNFVSTSKHFQNKHEGNRTFG